jgi:hypothetical protein
MLNDSQSFDAQERLIAIEARTAIGETLCKTMLTSTTKPL